MNYPYLPDGRKFKYVPITDPFMAETKKVTLEFSTDKNHPTGAVIVFNNEIVGRGANQSALKNKWLIKIHKRYFCVRRFLRVKSGQKYWLCPGCASHKMHSERLAIVDALKRRSSISGADLYHWGHWWCCKPCWDAMIAAGIRDVYLLDEAENLFK